MAAPSPPWPTPQTEAEVALHNARVAISAAEDYLDALKRAPWLDTVYEHLDLAGDILRGAQETARAEEA